MNNLEFENLLLLWKIHFYIDFQKENKFIS